MYYATNVFNIDLLWRNSTNLRNIIFEIWAFHRGYYYTTQAVRGPITKINQSKCSIAGPIFSKYRIGHCPEWSRTCVFAVFAFFSRVINLLLTNLAQDRTGRILALGLFCTDLGPIFSKYGSRAWLIRYINIMFIFRAKNSYCYYIHKCYYDYILGTHFF